MTLQSRRTAGILLVILPTVIYGGAAILSLLIDDPRYQAVTCAITYGGQGVPTPGVLLILLQVGRASLRG